MLPHGVQFSREEHMAIRYDLLYGYDRTTIEKRLAAATSPKERGELEESLMRLSKEEARTKQKAERRESLHRFMEALTSDRAFKFGVLILWLLTLCTWLYKPNENSGARYVFSESESTATVFDKRTGTIYRFQNNKWIAVNAIAETSSPK
jgi:hypothetical protein